MTKALLEYCTIHKPSAKSEAKDMKIRIKQEVLDSRRAATKDDKIKLCEIFALQRKSFSDEEQREKLLEQFKIARQDLEKRTESFQQTAIEKALEILSGQVNHTYGLMEEGDDKSTPKCNKGHDCVLEYVSPYGGGGAVCNVNGC